MTTMTFATVFNQTLTRSGIKPHQVAQAIGKSRQHIHDILHGQRHPSEPVALSIGRFLGWPDEVVYYLLDGLPPAVRGHNVSFDRIVQAYAAMAATLLQDA